MFLQPKCCQYWPVDVFEEAYGNIKVRVKTERRVGEDYIVRTLEVKQVCCTVQCNEYYFVLYCLVCAENINFVQTKEQKCKMTNTLLKYK